MEIALDDGIVGVDSAPITVARPSVTTPTTPRRALIAPIACACATTAGAVYVAINNPVGPGVHFPACPLYATTGFYCPGCGLTRATHAFLRGHIGAAFGFNLFFPLFLGAIVIGWFAWMRKALGRAPIRWLVRLPTWLPVAGGITLILFGVVRNLPGLHALAP